MSEQGSRKGIPFADYLKSQGKETLREATPEDIVAFLDSCTPSPRLDARGRPYRPPAQMVYTAFSLLVQVYGKPVWEHPTTYILLSQAEMTQAIAESRVLHVCSVHGDFASGDVRFGRLSPSQPVSDSYCSEQDLIVFPAPCRLTNDLVAFLNDNPWERAWDMRKALQG